MIFLTAKFGVFPKMHFFKLSELDEFFSQGNFQVLDTKEYSYHSVAEYFIVAGKV
jgi:hypothetical protein